MRKLIDEEESYLYNNYYPKAVKLSRSGGKLQRPFIIHEKKGRDKSAGSMGSYLW